MSFNKSFGRTAARDLSWTGRDTNDSSFTTTDLISVITDPKHFVQNVLHNLENCWLDNRCIHFNGAMCPATSACIDPQLLTCYWMFIGDYLFLIYHCGINHFVWFVWKITAPCVNHISAWLQYSQLSQTLTMNLKPRGCSLIKYFFFTIWVEIECWPWCLKQCQSNWVL